MTINLTPTAAHALCEYFCRHGLRGDLLWRFLAKELNAMIITAVLKLKEQHKSTWRDMPESYWFARLVEEVGELGGTLVGNHEGPTEWELKQIAAICLNWLEMREAENEPAS